MIGVTEAAQVLGLTRRQVQHLVERGDLTPASKMPGRTGALLFDAAEVDRFREGRDA